MMRIRPLHDFILIEPIETAARTAGGLHIPDNARDDHRTPIEGKVLAIGPGRLTDYGTLIAAGTNHPEHIDWEQSNALAVGNHVILRRHSGHLVEQDGAKLMLVQFTDILGVFVAKATAPAPGFATPEIETVEVAMQRDARRYRRLRVLGAAPGTSKNLGAGTVLTFTNLDAFVDADIANLPSRGEAK